MFAPTLLGFAEMMPAGRAEPAHNVAGYLLNVLRPRLVTAAAKASGNVGPCRVGVCLGHLSYRLQEKGHMVGV
jgi:hypothetical protein